MNPMTKINGFTFVRIVFSSSSKHEILHSMKCVYYPVITFTHYGWQDTLATIFLQALPCYFMDFFNPEKIRLLAVCRKIKSMKNVINYFMNKKIYFDNTNVANEVYARWVKGNKMQFHSQIVTANYSIQLKLYALILIQISFSFIFFSLPFALCCVQHVWSG